MTSLLLGLLLQGTPATHVLVVTGLGGEPRYSQAFVSLGADLVTSLRDRHGVAREQITWLAEDSAAHAAVKGRATREAVLAELSRLAQTSVPGDRVLLVLIGHGSDAGEARFNLPGRDLGASDLVPALQALTGRTVAVVAAASASGGLADELAGPGRVVITATKSGMERNEVQFSRVFVKAFVESAGDTDKDGRLSLAEAYAYATSEVERFYTADNRLQTEHARISDEPLAAAFRFSPEGGVVTAAPGDSVTAALLARKAQLEEQIAGLRARRGQLDPAAYEQELERLLVALAETNRALRERGGGP